jgi:hypothetical protein
MKGKAFIFNKKGWGNLASEFKFPPISWEMTTCQLGKCAKSHYIKIGNISTTPVGVERPHDIPGSI